MDVLCYGYYGKGANNFGDLLFKTAFKHLWPEINFTFTDIITKELLNNKAAVIFGGGSFLDSKPNLDSDALNIVSLPMLYISVGVETEIHPYHKALMSKAKVVAVRSGLDRAKEINSNAILIPDLVYSIPAEVKQKDSTNKILYLSNALLLPKYSDPYWKHLSWAHFKLEMAQWLDELIGAGNRIDAFSMCDSNVADDQRAMDEITNMMNWRHLIKSMGRNTDFQDVIDLFSQYDLIITQRYHGAILAEIAQKPYISIYHHDKLRSTHYNAGEFISYYSISKEELNKSLGTTLNKEKMPIDQHLFKDLILAVNKCLGLSQQEKITG